MGVFLVFGLTPWFRQVEEVPGGKLLLQILGGAIGIVGAPASIFIFFAMLIFCFRQDPSPVRVKLLWCIVFLITGWFGAVAYYFMVYRRQLVDAPASELERFPK